MTSQEYHHYAPFEESVNEVWSKRFADAIMYFCKMLKQTHYPYFCLYCGHIYTAFTPTEPQDTTKTNVFLGNIDIKYTDFCTPLTESLTAIFDNKVGPNIGGCILIIDIEKFYAFYNEYSKEKKENKSPIHLKMLFQNDKVLNRCKFSYTQLSSNTEVSYESVFGVYLLTGVPRINDPASPTYLETHSVYDIPIGIIQNMFERDEPVDINLQEGFISIFGTKINASVHMNSNDINGVISISKNMFLKEFTKSAVTSVNLTLYTIKNISSSFMLFRFKSVIDGLTVVSDGWTVIIQKKQPLI